VTVSCADGSVGTVLYVASGDAAMPKERIEVLGRGRSAVLDNFQSLTTWSGSRKKVTRALALDKGHAHEIDRWIACLRDGLAPPIALDAIASASWATLATIESLASGRPVDVAPDGA
jgi:hypothetical protein